MYIPKHFEASEAIGREIMQAHGWALLVSTDGDGAPFCTHLALVWQDDGTPHGSLIGHLARANPHWKLFANAAPSMALFWGPHAYVSPTWYAPGPKVPTWNYVTVHAYGRPEVIENPKQVLEVLADLAKIYEGSEGWGLGALPPGNAEAQIRGIVAFRIWASALPGGRAPRPHRDMEDRRRVIARLEAADGDDAKATAMWMKKVLP